MTRIPRSLRERLATEGHRFDFYQAVRLLDLLRRKSVANTEPVRFRSRISLAFPASDVQEVRIPEHGPFEMVVNFMGLAGLLGPLPMPLTELVLQAQNRTRSAIPVVDFLDIFNHRLLELMYRVRETHRPALTSLPPSKGVVARCLFSLIGLGHSALREAPATVNGRTALSRRLSVENGLLYYAGILAARPRSAVGLQRILADYFDVRIKVRQFVGRWRRLQPRQWTVIGGPKRRNTRLGVNAVIGTRVWDMQSHIRIRVGPMPRAKYLAMLPGNPAHDAMIEIIRFYIDPEVTFSLSFRLENDDAFTTDLGSRKLRLGFTTWLSPLEPESAGTTVTVDKDY